MNKLNTQERAQIISCLAEGCSLLSTVRLTCHSRKGVASVLVGAGTACAKYHDKIMRNLTCKLIQVDEVWQWVYCKQANIPKELKGIYGVGDTWTWIALDAFNLSRIDAAYYQHSSGLCNINRKKVT